MLNYHTTPQITAVHHYGSYITHWVGIHFGETAFLHMVIQEPRLLPCYTVSIPLEHIPICIHKQKKARIWRNAYGSL